MNYGTVKSVDIANGDGVRVSLFVSGCTHHCPGCFNPETWDFGYGVPFDRGAEERIMRLLDRSYINGLSLLGGEPFEPENQRALLPLVRRVRAELPKKISGLIPAIFTTATCCPAAARTVKRPMNCSMRWRCWSTVRSSRAARIFH